MKRLSSSGRDVCAIRRWRSSLPGNRTGNMKLGKRPGRQFLVSSFWFLVNQQITICSNYIISRYVDQKRHTSAFFTLEVKTKR